MKKKAPVQATGGAGFRYENVVAARFLLDLLGGTNALGVDFGRITRIDWQARDSGWLADDLAIACKPSGGDRRTAALSIKSSQQVTRAGFPRDFVKIAWAQWLGIKTDRRLRDSDNTLVLVTGNLADDVKDAWSNLLHDALQTAPERMAARLSQPAADDGSQSSALQRALVESFSCPEELRSSGDTDNVAAIQLMCRVRLFHFDYEATPSRDHAQALADCQRVLKSGAAAEAERLWGRLIGIADAKRAGGSIDLPQLLAELRGEFDFRDHPDYRRDWEVLQRLSQDRMGDVRTEIAGLPPLPRVADRAMVQTYLNQHRGCLLVGESGCGKSALAKEIGQACYRRVVWIAENTLDYDTAGEFERGIGISHPLVEVLTTLPGPCLVVFDGIERYSPRALRLASRFMQDLLADAGPQHAHVLVTAQFEAADRLIRRFIEFGVPPSMHTATPLERPSEDDVHTLVARIAGLTWASLRPELRPLLTNLKVLDWVVAAAQSGTAINDPSFIGLTYLIDALWERWIEGDSDGTGPLARIDASRRSGRRYAGARRAAYAA